MNTERVDPNDPDAPLYWRALDDDFEICVWPMLGGKGRLTIGFRDTGTYEDGYCYPSRRQAIEAAKVWSGEGDPPDGWHRHIATGRRRENGDPSKESIRW